MAQTVPGKSVFFVRSNYAVEARHGIHREAMREEQSFQASAQELILLIAQAIATIEKQDEPEAALRALWASLLRIRGLCRGDPGIRMAAQDLYDAATALVRDKPSEGAVIDIRRWRLLREADSRLRRRLEDRAR
jgi:hypothetical protein